MRTTNKVPIIKERVKKVLSQEGITQKELADEMGLTPEHLNRCLKEGFIYKPWLTTIADILDVSPFWLSIEDAAELNMFGFKRGEAIKNRKEILKGLFILAGYGEDDFLEFSDNDLDALIGDIQDLIAVKRSSLIDGNRSKSLIAILGDMASELEQLSYEMDTIKKSVSHSQKQLDSIENAFDEMEVTNGKH